MPFKNKEKLFTTIATVQYTYVIICVTELLGLLTSDHEVAGWSPANGKILSALKLCFFAQGLS